MARILFGQMIAEARGKVGGLVFSRNRAGSYMRTKVTPTNPQTAKQTGVRTFFTTIAQAWRGLTAVQRLQWEGAVENFKSSNIFGLIKTLSGAQLYQKLNVNLLNIGQAQISEPPVPTSVPAITSISIVADESANSLTATFSPAIDANVIYEAFATPPTSAGKTFVKNMYKKIGNYGVAAVSPLVMTGDYNAIYGTVGTEGQKIFLKMVPIHMTTGIRGAAIECSTVVVA